MGKIAFMFPGQGAQYIGMGKDFYENIPVCKEIFDKATQVSGIDIPKLCFEENEQINITEYTQIAMVATEISILKALEEKGITPDVTGGLSLGEYGALAASHVMTIEDIFKVIRKRGIFMQEAVPNGGAMVAVLGLDTVKIEEICESIEGMITIANYNCPGQIVITGEEKAAAEAIEKLTAAGAKRCVPLKVSGPFHSPLLAGAGEKLAEELKEITVNDFTIPYAANVTAQYVTKKEDVKELLQKQVSSSVKWQQSVELMIADGVDTFVEIGPGKTLSNFVKKINRDMKVCNIDKLEDLDKAVAMIKGE